MMSPSVLAGSLCEEATMENVLDAEVRRATGMPDHDGTRSES
jgi:hypothetical protein